MRRPTLSLVHRRHLSAFLTFAVAALLFALPAAAVAAPTVSDVNSNNGSYKGGNTVTVTGTGFAAGATVKFGATKATAVTVNSSTSITTTTPAGTGTVHVTVTTAEGTSATTGSDQFAYDPAPQGPWLGLNANFGGQGENTAQKFQQHGIAYDAGYGLDLEAGQLVTPGSLAFEYLAEDLKYGMRPIITIRPAGWNPAWGTPLPKGSEITTYVTNFVKTAQSAREAFPEPHLVFQPINEPYGHGSAAEYAGIVAQLLPAAQTAGIPLEDIYIAAYGKDIYSSEQWVTGMYTAKPELKTLIGGWNFHPYGPAEGEDSLHREGIQSVPWVQQLMTSGQNNIIVSEVGFWTPDVNEGKAKGGPESAWTSNSEMASAYLTKMLTNARPMHDAGWLRALLVYNRTEGGWAMETGGSLTQEGSALISFADWDKHPRIEGAQTATEVGADKATLVIGALFSGGYNTTYQFEYGQTESYGSKAPIPAGETSEYEGIELRQKITGLEPKTTYHFRLKATNAYGVTYSEDHTFTTKTSPAFAGNIGVGTLSRPADAAVDSSGNIWVVDRLNNRLVKFNPQGTVLQTIGSLGSANGQLNAPESVAITPQGNLWVTDSGNIRVQEFSPAGAFIAKFGSKGTGTGQFSEWGPKGIAVDRQGNLWVTDYSNRAQEFNQFGEAPKVIGAGQFSQSAGIDVGPEGKIWISDWEANRVRVYNEAGELKTTFGTSGTSNGQFTRPDALEVDSRGNVWVADETERIQEFNQAGTYVGQFGSTGSGEGQLSLSWPFGLTSDAKGNLWIADTSNNRVQHWEIADYVPSYQFSVGGGGSGAEGDLYRPADAAADSSGNVWVVDRLNNRLEKFGPNGEFLAKLGSKGSGDGQLESPRGVAIDSTGNIWVADSGNGRIEEFNSKGEYLSKFGSKGASPGQFSSWGPKDLAFDSTGNIWVTDYSTRIQRFEPTGKFLKSVGGPYPTSPEFAQAAGIDVGPGGKIWVSDWELNQVEVLSETGSFLSKFGVYGTEPSKFQHPDTLDVDAQGNVWVGDEANSRVQEFNQSGEYVTQFGTAGSGAGQFKFGWSFGVADDGKGNLWVADSNNNRLQKWRYAP